MDNSCAKLSAKGMGFSLGLLWAVAMFATGMIASITNWGHSFIAVMSSLYVGFEPTLMGSLIGAVWAFVDWFIGGWIIAWLYNCFSGCCPHSRSSNTSETCKL